MQVRITQPGVTPSTYSIEGNEDMPPICLDITLPWDPRDIDAVHPLPGQNSSSRCKPASLSDLDVCKYLGEHAKDFKDSCPALTELLIKVAEFLKRHAALPSSDRIGPQEDEEERAPEPEVKPIPKTEVRTNPEMEVKPVPETEVKPTPKTEVKPAPEAEEKPTPKTEVKTNAATDVKRNPEGLQPGNERKFSFVNDGDKPMTLHFTPNAGDQALPDIVIPPGEARTVQFPEGWGGNVRSTTGEGPATLVELKFEPGKTWADVSHIDGSNAYATIETPDGKTKTGMPINLLEEAPESLIMRDASGKAYGIKPATVAEMTDPAVVAFLDKHIPSGQGYKYPTDDKSTTAFDQSNLIVHMRDYS